MQYLSGGEPLYKLVRAETGKAPVSRVDVIHSDGMAIVHIYTCRPETLAARQTPQLAAALAQRLRRPVTIQILPEAQAVGKYLRVSPTKARRVMNLIRGKYVDEALAILRFTPNRAARYIEKVLQSAAANAFEGWGADPGELKISRLVADPGPTLKRVQPRAQGRAYRILRRTSHITVAVQHAGERVARTGRRRGATVRRAEPRPAAARTSAPAPAPTEAKESEG